MQGDEVRVAQELVERVAGTGVEHPHREALGALGDRPPDPPEADDPERLAVDLAAEV